MAALAGSAGVGMSEWVSVVWVGVGCGFTLRLVVEGVSFVWHLFYEGPKEI